MDGVLSLDAVVQNDGGEPVRTVEMPVNQTAERV